MPIRNPFTRRPPPPLVTLTQTQDENRRPGSGLGSPATPGSDVAHPGFERVDTVGSSRTGASSAFSIRSSRRSQDTGEYKMSVVNDSGVYLPPSPIEREATWPRRYLSRTSSDKGSRNSGEIEHFPISRESFDSYRRSFDISAKTPAIIPPDALPPRQSLDSRVARYQPPAAAPPPRSPLAPPASYGRSSSDQQQYQNRRYFEPHAEERFEDVGLGDEGKGPQQSQQSQHEEGGGLHLFPRKRGFFAKFGGSESGTAPTTTTASSTEQAGGAGTGLSRLLPLGGGSGGRKRAQSGQGGQELGVMERPASSRGVLQAQEVEG